MLPMQKTGVAFFLFVGLVLLTATFVPAAPLSSDPPNQGTTHGTTYTFYWVNGHQNPYHLPVPACSWRLKVGSVQNGDNIFSGPLLPASSNSQYVDTLPADGKAYWVTPSYQKVCPGGPFYDGNSTTFTSAP